MYSSVQQCTVYCARGHCRLCRLLCRVVSRTPRFCTRSSTRSTPPWPFRIWTCRTFKDLYGPSTPSTLRRNPGFQRLHASPQLRVRVIGFILQFDDTVWKDPKTTRPRKCWQKSGRLERLLKTSEDSWRRCSFCMCITCITSFIYATKIYQKLRWLSKSRSSTWKSL